MPVWLASDTTATERRGRAGPPAGGPAGDEGRRPRPAERPRGQRELPAGRRRRLRPAPPAGPRPRGPWAARSPPEPRRPAAAAGGRSVRRSVLPPGASSAWAYLTDGGRRFFPHLISPAALAASSASSTRARASEIRPSSLPATRLISTR